MRLFSRLLAGLLLLAALALRAQTPALPSEPAALDWSPIDAAVRAQIEAGAIPGAVIVAGDAERIWLHRAWGWRAREPADEAMTPDTVFDLASLTKVVATTMAVLQLAERGRLALDAPMARYWPAFAAQGKGEITVAQLLAHTSGLRAGLAPGPPGEGRRAVLARLLAENPIAPPGQRMVYSDLNFVVLGELVQRVSGQALPRYAARRIFAPLAMRDTGFLPRHALRPRIAPTERVQGELLRGVVHDPLARRLGGWAGHAGLFGSADDLARFAQALLGGAGRHRLLSQASIAALRLPQSPPEQAPWRGLGWQLEAPLAAGRDARAPVGAIGHTGYTGTGLWIDFVQRRFVVILTARVHPDGRGDARPLRRQVLALVSSIAPPVDPARLEALDPRLAAAARLPPPPQEAPPVANGIDRLREDGFAALRGKRVALVSNLASLDARGWRTLDRLRWADGVQLVKLFTPEHGLFREQEGRVPSGHEPLSGLPIESLYGEVRQPTPTMLQGLDLLVFDLQDAGARFFTYISTLGLAMEAAAEAGLPVLVLDRPNPQGGLRIGGPVLDEDLRSFTGYARLPMLHGMTVGELARLFRDEIRARRGLEVQLDVVPMTGWQRAMRWEQTGLDWVPPSPNLRRVETALLYPGTAWVEGANLSVGRGTDQPFARVGAPWIAGARLAELLNREALPGLAFTPVDFVPQAGPYAGRRCAGVAIELRDREQLDAPLLGASLVHALLSLWPESFRLDRTQALIGSRQTLDDLRAGLAPRAVAKRWQPELQRFAERRAAYLLYP